MITANFVSKTDTGNKVELYFSCLHVLVRNHKWFCRIWLKDWRHEIRAGKRYIGEAYGKNKFEAYRLALNNLNK